MDYSKVYYHRAPTMLAAMRSRRFVVLAALSFVLFLAVFSHSYSSDGLTDRISFGNGGLRQSTIKPSRPPGKFHYLIAASKPNLQFCRALVSSTVNRYGPPVVAGWHGEGELDANSTHLAKVRVVASYLDSLPDKADDDLFMLIDGYDVQMQLGADVLIDRYYQVVAMEDERLIRQLGPSHAERIAGPLSRHIMFGADKICWPTDWWRPTCWAVPDVPGMDDGMYGPKTNKGEMHYYTPRWLNSGTIMGPVKETRDFFHATLDMINATYNPEYIVRESDQYYMGEVWGLQEIDRINQLLAIDFNAPHPSGPEDRHWPELEKGINYNFHIAMDYWSHLFQTQAGYGNWLDWRRFDGPGFSKTIDQNVRQQEPFTKWDMTLEGDAMASIDRIFHTTPPGGDGTPGSTPPSGLPATSDELLRQSEFGSNIITRTTLALFHCTGNKTSLDKYFPRMWFHKYARVLMRSAIAFFARGEPYTRTPIDGRLWYPANSYPQDQLSGPEDGGAWSDGSDPLGVVEWLGFDEMCKEYEAELF